MTPKILFIGGEKGSWEVRGRQIGAALGAKVTVHPNRNDFLWADVIVLVKRAIDRWGHESLRSGKPLIWDVLDFWEQPQENSKTEAELVAEVKRRQAVFSCTLIGATRAMAQAIGGVYLPHHSRPGLVPSAPRQTLGIVAYEGRIKYLGSWRQALETACAKLGAAFVINPKSLSDADVVVAFRGEQWDGPICRAWKSGVKCVNALVAGRPIVTQLGAGFLEIKPVGEAIDHQGYLVDAIQRAWSRRAEAYALAQRMAPAYRLPVMANRYRELANLVRRRAA